MTDNLRVTLQNGKYIIGTNETTAGNGYINKDIAGSVLTIPSKIDEKKIEEIGQYAFHRCFNIEEVFISDSIRAINQWAISDCYNLRSIIIPPSVEFIGTVGIHTYNRTKRNIYSNLPLKSYTSKGVLNVVFQPHSRIQYIGEFGISRKENIIVHYYDHGLFSCHSDIFYISVIQRVKIISPYSSSFCGYPTSYIRTCQSQRRLHSLHIFIVVMFILA